jgi:hypothetical protein
MYLKSPYPDVPTALERNVHYIMFHRPEQEEWNDFTLHINPKSGKRRTFRQFLDRMQLGMNVLGAPVAEGGLGLGTWKANEMVGIMSPNSMVCWPPVIFSFALTLPIRITSRSFSVSLVSRHRSYLYLRIPHRSSSSMRSNYPSARICSLILNFYPWFFQSRTKWGYHRAKYTSLGER